MPFGTVTSTFVIGMSMLTATMVGESRYLSESARRAVCGRARDERERVSDVRTRSSRKKGGLRGSALGTRCRSEMLFCALHLELHQAKSLRVRNPARPRNGTHSLRAVLRTARARPARLCGAGSVLVNVGRALVESDAGPDVHLGKCPTRQDIASDEFGRANA